MKVWGRSSTERARPRRRVGEQLVAAGGDREDHLQVAPPGVVRPRDLDLFDLEDLVPGLVQGEELGPEVREGLPAEPLGLAQTDAHGRCVTFQQAEEPSPALESFEPQPLLEEGAEAGRDVLDHLRGQLSTGFIGLFLGIQDSLKGRHGSISIRGGSDL